MRLSAPTFMTILVSLVLAVLGVVAHYITAQLPVIGTHSFAALLLGYVVLLAGIVVRGL